MLNSVVQAQSKALEKTNHWAFRPPLPSPAPLCKESGWVRNEIDAFVLSRLEKEGLHPSAEADRRTLIRRLKFDLIGLPPTPEEVSNFVDDADPMAYEHLVDRYLASPQFGERWARHWLDVVRFAESNGFETNTPRPNSYYYRDYVIKALNSDKPYDRFVFEQLAGDSIGEDSATGFIVGGPWDEVKSPDINLTLQQRMDELHDMVATTGSAFLGLTVGCARCHDHKFDPIPQTDYYAIQAVFAGVQHGERMLRVSDYEERTKEAEKLRARLPALDHELQKFEPTAFGGRTVILEEFPIRTNANGGGTTALIATSARADYPSGTNRGEADDPGGATWTGTFSPSYSAWEKVREKDVFAWEPRVSGRFRIWLSWGSGWNTHATDAKYILDADGDLGTTNDQQAVAVVNQQLFADRSGTVPNKPLWSGFYDAGVWDLNPNSRLVLRGGQSDAWVSADVVVFQEATNGEPNSQPLLRGPVDPKVNIEKFAPTLGTAVRFTMLATTDAEPCIDELEVWNTEGTNVALASNGGKPSASGTYSGSEFHKLEHINDGKVGNSRSWISNEQGKGWVRIDFPQPATVERIVWGRDRDEKFADRLATIYKIELLESSGTKEQWVTIASSDDRREFDRKQRGHTFAFAAHLPTEARERLFKLQKERSQTEEKLRALASFPKVYAGRFEEPGPTYRLNRGEPLQKREQVNPGALSHMSCKLDMSPDTPEKVRRVAFAKWIASAENPLTARVIVNRLWQYHFGEGLVSTPSDFGANGARPTHPELLDWLALQLVREGWSLKAIHRLIVTSATYRQSSAMNPEAAERDAANRLLWRFTPHRLEAEPLRDAILFVCGNLDPRMGGKGFDLFQPNDNYVRVFNSKTNFGPGEWRRMIYVTKHRMRLDDTFGAFDCPDAGQIAPKRNSSTTPLQAFNLLNSSFAMQQAQILARRIAAESGSDPSSQARRGFDLVFQREPFPKELPPAAEVIKQTGLTEFCRAILNANEFIYVF
jgi:hypothetical protein